MVDPLCGATLTPTHTIRYTSRSGMWRFRLALVGCCVHIGEYVKRAGVRAQVNDMRIHGRHTMSGLVTENTKFVFRSRSARVV